MIVEICKVILDLLIIACAVWGLALVNPVAKFFIIALSLMFVWGAMLLVLCFKFGAIGYSVSVLTPILFLIIYKIKYSRGE